MLVFNSDDHAPKQRVEAWQEFSARSLAALRSVAAGEQRFQANVKGKLIGDLMIGRLQGAGHISERTRLEISQQPRHHYGAVIHLGGKPLMRCRGRLIQVQPGDISILSTMDDFWFDGEAPFEYMVVRLPERWPDSRMFRPELLTGSVISRANPLRGILVDYVVSVFHQSDRLPASAAAAVAQHILDLLSATLVEEPLQIGGSAALRAALFDSACRMIASHATDPELRTEAIARRLRISVRMLQRIFKENDATVAQRISMARIARSATMLANDRGSGATITEIAFASGFRDLTTFERAFCASKGMTPSAWRRRALQSPTSPT
ncbi:helix-turn-helix domain-containing protein [Steroidobacter gossypii]|nr:helix-turn-helix domain-containing protein [Steroidobacter gossypii]